MPVEQLDDQKHLGLRELKKRRTREVIVRVAIDLFSSHGFQATTLAEIATAAEIAPSTLHAYFPTKSDIVFDHQSKVLASARTRLVERPMDESTTEALEQWLTTDLPELVNGAGEDPRSRRAIIDADDELLTQERARAALLEDVFAQAFARDLHETPDALRSRLMAAVTLAGLSTAWLWSYRHRSGTDFDPRAPYALDRTYVTTILAAAEAAIEQIPGPA